MLLALSVMGVSCAAALPAAENTTGWLAHNDVVYDSPAREGWEGLPLGNGTLGAAGLESEFVGLSSQYALERGARFLHREDAVADRAGLLSDFTGYKQRLVLSTATLLTDVDTPSGPIRIKSWIAAGADVLVIEVDDRRREAIEETLDIETWHPTVKFDLRPNGLQLTDNFASATNRGYHPVSGSNAAYPFALALGTDSRAGVRPQAPVGGVASLRVGAKSYTVFAAFAGARDPKADVADQAQSLLDRCRKAGVAKLRAEHEAWWAKFWSRSYIQLDGPEGMPDYLANLWYMHLYAMASGSRGEVPPKFNGGLWTFIKDEREWGPGYWHWNEQEPYWPLYAANHLELIEPYYRMYSAMLPKVERQTKDYFGVAGAHFAETIIWDGSDATGKGPKVMGVHPRLPTPKSYANTCMILSSSAEIAMQFWWNYLYTGDDKFLRNRAYPLMKSVGQFYVNYLEKDAGGRYIMYPSNAHEAFWKVQNPTPDLAGIRYVFNSLIEASKRLNADAEMRPVWQDRLDHLAAYATDPKTGAILPFEQRPGEVYNRKSSPGNSSGEKPNLFAVGVFPLITLGSPDYQLGLKTFHNRYTVGPGGWAIHGIAACALGLASDLALGANECHRGPAVAAAAPRRCYARITHRV